MAAQTLPGWQNFAQLLATPQAGTNPLAPTGQLPGATPVPGATGLPPLGATGSPVAQAAPAGLPGIEGLSTQATQRISDLMAGKLPSDVQAVIQQGRAQQAFSSGMPGSSRISGSLQGNATLRDLGITSLQAGQQGMQDLNSLMGAYYGNVTPTAGQNLSATVQREGQQNEIAMQTQRLDQAAAQFQQSFGQAERQMAQSLGISERDLAYKLAALEAQTANNQGRLALDTAGLNQAASQFAQSRELGPKDVAELSKAPFLPQGTLASLLAKYGVGGGGVGQLAVTGAGMSPSTIGRY